MGRGLRFIVLIPEEQKAYRFHLFSILPSHVLFLDSLKPLWHLQIGIWGRSGSARHEAFPPHNNRVALEHGTASVKKKRKLYVRKKSYLDYSLAQLLHVEGVSAHTWQKTDRPHPCHPWTKNSPKLVANVRKDTEKQPYIWTVKGTVAMSRCAGASRAKIETSRSLRFECVKRLYEMNVTVETIRTNIRISSLPLSCSFGGVARVARERRRDCQLRRGESRSLARSFAARFTSNK